MFSASGLLGVRQGLDNTTHFPQTKNLVNFHKLEGQKLIQHFHFNQSIKESNLGLHFSNNWSSTNLGQTSQQNKQINKSTFTRIKQLRLLICKQVTAIGHANNNQPHCRTITTTTTLCLFVFTLSTVCF
jgi:hypothetical protein